MIEASSVAVTVFPADAGMNRDAAQAALDKRGVPRRRGDEPGGPEFQLPELRCSPQTRG